MSLESTLSLCTCLCLFCKSTDNISDCVCWESFIYVVAAYLPTNFPKVLFAMHFGWVNLSPNHVEISINTQNLNHISFIVSIPVPRVKLALKVARKPPPHHLEDERKSNFISLLLTAILNETKKYFKVISLHSGI